jgi:drug/metabolite transporter (DMT)-like permease
MTSATVTASLVFWLPVAAWDVSLHGLPPVSAAAMLAIAFMAVGMTILGYWIWFLALQHVDAGRVGLTIFVQPLFGTLLSVWILEERLTLATWVGGGLVLASLAFALRPEPQRR